LSSEEADRHPDALIHELVAEPERPATADELVRILEHIARSPFNTRRVEIPSELVGEEFLGKKLGKSEDSLTVHLARRVFDNAQWSSKTTREDFLNDIRRAILHPDAALAVYETPRTDYAVVAAPNIVSQSRLGRQPGKFMVVPYSANRGRSISAWQAKDEESLLIPERARWIKPLKNPESSRS
jgi:hypothetical protein